MTDIFGRRRNLWLLAMFVALSLGGGTTIGRASLDGSGVNQSVISGAITPTGVAVSSIPEPSTGLLVVAGLLGLSGRRRARA